MALKIMVIKIKWYTVFSRGVVSFLQITENVNNMFFSGKSITNVIIKTNEMICSAMGFPNTALL